MKSLEDGAWAGKRVLVRIDADVPLGDSKPIEVRDDYRLQELLPTLFYLLNHRAQIILCGHLGRPAGQIVPSLSLKPVFLHLSALVNQKITFVPDPFSVAGAKAIKQLDDREIIGLENIRFFKGEGDNSRTFARKLAGLADVFVNEAFGSGHESASTVAITEFLPSFAGLQFEREVEVLSSLTKHPARPFIAIIGGAKATDKLPVISGLLETVDRVLVGGRVANNFLASQSVDIKDSVVEPAMVTLAGQLFKQAKGKIILPTDFVWHEQQIYDLGQQTTATMLDYIRTAKTVLWSGVPGKVELPAFAKASQAIARAIAELPATTIVGGGDTVGFIQGLGLTEKYSFVSTGGSAMLELLSGHTLPSIKALD